jgi:hypothetical protein
MELFSYEDPRPELCVQIAEGLIALKSYCRAVFFYRLAQSADPTSGLLQGKIDEALKQLSDQ